ncbi:tetratricopeptide repeat protein [Aureliella helgolandensis]|uniref:Photosystem I assembly protein Ycf3 n=1 Tax=Aureliella helgolandensis TaxID=2527968 RepID=A0A518GFT2_9BACT|nr:tetratricopeptide repeat protein [Aureliella helgolandensis]QDV27466.1 photosystem I assembly protein Ycf3 [Aureliella helgolandensis]
MTASHTTRHLYVAAMLLMLAATSSGCRWNSMGQNSMGVRLYEQGRYNEALQQFQSAQAADPSDPDSYYNLASTYHKLGIGQKDAKMIEQSEALYNQCLDLQPNHVDCHRGLAVLLVESGRKDSALKLLNNWSTTNPGLSDAKVELARLNQELGQTQLAERYLDEALAMNPQDPRAWNARGQLREASGDLGQALQNYQQSLALNSLQGDLYQRIASLNVKIAQNTAAGITQNTGAWTAQNPQPGTASPPRY